jgi:cbb3-type cytochrome oxidase maturation protein
VRLGYNLRPVGILYVVVPIAVAIVVLALLAFRWAVRSGQLDDLDTPAVRMLHDDEPDRTARGRGSDSEGDGPARTGAEEPRR